jgi:hypothetical protein
MLSLDKSCDQSLHGPLRLGAPPIAAGGETNSFSPSTRISPVANFDDMGLTLRQKLRNPTDRLG